MAWPAIIPFLRYEDAPAMVSWLEDAFGFSRHAYHEEGGEVVHGEIAFENGLFMIGSVRDAGAEIVMEPTDQDYGSRDYVARDPEGFTWSFGTYRPEP